MILLAGGSRKRQQADIEIAKGLRADYKKRKREESMPLTRSFRGTVNEQLAHEDFRREFLREAVSNMIAGDLETATSVPREYINGTIGFPLWVKRLRSHRRA